MRAAEIKKLHRALADRFRKQIAEHGYRSSEYQWSMLRADFPTARRPDIGFAISGLIDDGHVTHEQVADASVQDWLGEAVAQLTRTEIPMLHSAHILKKLIGILQSDPDLTREQRGGLDYVQLRVALYRAGVPYYGLRGNLIDHRAVRQTA